MKQAMTNEPYMNVPTPQMRSRTRKVRTCESHTSGGRSRTVTRVARRLPQSASRRGNWRDCYLKGAQKVQQILLRAITQLPVVLDDPVRLRWSERQAAALAGEGLAESSEGPRVAA